MRVRNVSSAPIETPEGRTIGPGEFGEVNSSNERIARHLASGRLARAAATQQQQTRRRSRDTGKVESAEKPADTESADQEDQA